MGTPDIESTGDTKPIGAPVALQESYGACMVENFTPALTDKQVWDSLMSFSDNLQPLTMESRILEFGERPIARSSSS